jgi:hypothetical protein
MLEVLRVWDVCCHLNLTWRSGPLVFTARNYGCWILVWGPPHRNPLLNFKRMNSGGICKLLLKNKVT